MRTSTAHGLNRDADWKQEGSGGCCRRVHSHKSTLGRLVLGIWEPMLAVVIPRAMEHRHLVSQPQMSVRDQEQIWNHPYLILGPGAFISPENIAVCGPNSVAFANPAPAANYPVMPNFNIEAPCYVRANSRMAHESYTPYPSVRSSSQFPPYYCLHEPCFNQVTVGDINGTINPPTDYDAAAYKRKMPAIQTFPDSGSTNGHRSDARSSNRPVLTGLFESTHTLGPHCFLQDPVNMASSYRSNNLLSSEEDHWNVRSRPASVLHPGNISLTNHSSSNFSDHFHPLANTSGVNLPGHRNLTPVPLDPHVTLISSGIGSFNHEMNQLHGRHATNIAVDIDGRRNFFLIPGWPSPDLMPKNIVQGQLKLPICGLEANLVDFRLPAVGRVVPPRYPGHPSLQGHMNERNGSIRIRDDGGEGIGHGRWVSETLAVMDRSTFYDSRTLFDEHHDMRLDIDNMSYEDLLALEERIGSVNTGLSEVAISRCLMETIYCYDQTPDDHEKGRCTICLETYKGKDCLGRLNCGHDFHACCIKKWLPIKNACPICKASALTGSLLEQ
ncbi:zinc finger, C3HC4 type, domain containing protein [Musa troglodytarum]|uniref:RING-type E3 ubiquitin transferase n=1 Tax=Musa troglodytarum TaxID=320322 RepID=A0A9E7EM35_9LILI|nr:zinc finger, C3HC4 type, domain containing protein [Musa troglodytarum]